MRSVEVSAIDSVALLFLRRWCLLLLLLLLLFVRVVVVLGAGGILLGERLRLIVGLVDGRLHETDDGLRMYSPKERGYHQLIQPYLQGRAVGCPGMRMRRHLLS